MHRKTTCTQLDSDTQQSIFPRSTFNAVQIVLVHKEGEANIHFALLVQVWQQDPLCRLAANSQSTWLHTSRKLASKRASGGGVQFGLWQTSALAQRLFYFPPVGSFSSLLSVCYPPVISQQGRRVTNYSTLHPVHLRSSLLQTGWQVRRKRTAKLKKITSCLVWTDSMTAEIWICHTYIDYYCQKNKSGYYQITDTLNSTQENQIQWASMWILVFFNPIWLNWEVLQRTLGQHGSMNWFSRSNDSGKSWQQEGNTVCVKFCTVLYVLSGLTWCWCYSDFTCHVTADVN